jgi:hypothetical protein
MKDLRGEASGITAASLADTMQLLQTAEDYPKWFPTGVKEVTVLDRDDHGRATRVQAKLVASVGPITREFDPVLSVDVTPPGTVTLTRIPRGPSDAERFQVNWNCDEVTAGTKIELVLLASLSVPRFVPMTGVGEALGRGFLDAAVKALGPA